MKKNITAFIVSMVFVLAVALPIAELTTGGKIGTLNVVAATYQNSGRSSVAKPTWSQLAAMYDGIPSYSTLFSKTPTVRSGNYATGTITPQASARGLKLINYYRAVAGVGSITFSNDLNASAAYASLVNSANNKLSHSPSQPSGMSTSIYNAGYAGASQSNISSASGYDENEIISLALKGQMADASTSNITMLGHRRWLLHPSTVFMGLGCSKNSNGYFTAIRIMGPGTSGATISDYNFISWPASGNNLSDTFDVNTPWSISLNPARYATPSKSKITVTLTQVSNGMKWTFNSRTGNTNSSTSNFLHVNTNGYGINNCIIFRPAYSNLRTYSGDYIVTVSGISTKAGAATSLSYKVSFDSRSHITAANNVTAKTTAKTTTAPSRNNNTIYIAASYSHAASTSLQRRYLKPAAYGNPKFTFSSNSRYITVNSAGVVTIAKNYIGCATITINSAQTTNYKAATKKINIVVYPPKTPIYSMRSARRSLTVAWKRTAFANGYQITYSTNPTFKTGTRTVKVSSRQSSYSMKWLLSKRRYYVKVRAYRIVGNKIYYGINDTVRVGIPK